LRKAAPLKPEQKTADLFKKWSGSNPERLSRLKTSGSNRQYFRLSYQDTTAIGVYNPNIKENRAFVTFTRHFLKHSLKVPMVYLEERQEGVYLLEDLGDANLFDLVSGHTSHGAFPEKIHGYYREAIDNLIKFQLIAGASLDYSVCYPRPRFDRQSIMWDLNYFKYNFLKLAGLEFNEQLLENDFAVLADFLLEEDNDCFMYRDFQARNMMIHKGSLYFIDYQGGRKGPLAYDVASLLFQVRADLPFDMREELLDYYIRKASGLITIEPKRFKKYYYGFVMLRLLQVLGAYGLRGLFERKEHFLLSIPCAVKNFVWLSEHAHPEIKIPALDATLEAIHSQYAEKSESGKDAEPGLNVALCSFSYKKGLPADNTGNGGGFIFDCRALPNPGRLEEYTDMTGKDLPVIAYLEKDEKVANFLQAVENIVTQSIENYLDRGFSNLMVSFGCTGGQHRSVYCAEKTRHFIEQNFPVKVKLVHRELE
jgi:aminoglycoside/choline kinase family phosphotransferase